MFRWRTFAYYYAIGHDGCSVGNKAFNHYGIDIIALMSLLYNVIAIIHIIIVYWPARFRDDHLGTKLVELVPQIFGLQPATDVLQLFRVTPFLEHRIRGRGGRHDRRRWRARRRRRYHYLVGRRVPGRPDRDHRVAAQTTFSQRFSVYKSRHEKWNKNKKTKNIFIFFVYLIIGNRHDFTSVYFI